MDTEIVNNGVENTQNLENTAVQTESTPEAVNKYDPTPAKEVVSAEKPAKEQSLEERIQEKIKSASKAKEPAKTAEKATDSSKQGAGQPLSGTEAYVPNFKYKAADKQLEIPEMYRSLIKDKESEKQVREVFEKIDGFERTKARAEKFENEYKTIESDFKKWQQDITPYMKRYEEVTQYLQNKDLDSLIPSLGIDMRDLEEWMLNRLKLTDPNADPMARKLYQDQVAAKQSQYKMQGVEQQYKEQLEQEKNQRIALEAKIYNDGYERAIQQPDVLPVVEFVTSKWGDNAFLQEAISIASQRKMAGTPFQTPQEAVQAVVEKFKPLISASNTPAGEAEKKVIEAAKQVGSSGKLPVIPHIQGQDMSPVKKTFKTLAELNAYAKSQQQIKN